jgi:hypothetical protein
MDKLVIRGGTPLLGTVRISGAKNAALPAMAAALLTEEPVVLENIPQVRDIETTRKLLAAMGAEVELGYGRAHHRTTLCCGKLVKPEAAYELVKTMRASTLVLGPLVARYGEARVSLPGGCAIGARPIDLHIKAGRCWRTPRVSPRSRSSPGCSTRWARRFRARAVTSSPSTGSRRSRRWTTPSSRTASRPEPCWWRRQSPAATCW